MSNRVKRRSSEARFEMCRTRPTTSESTHLFTFSTTEYNYAATDCVSVHRRHAGDRATTDSGGVRYYCMRYYNPDLGRWVSRDPIGEDGCPNLFAFTDNSALHLIDVLGKWTRSPLPGTGVPYNPEEPIRTPGIGDHFRGGGNYLGEEEWFENNYSGWLGEARKRFKEEVNGWVKDNCLRTGFQGPSSRINIYPSFDRGGSTSRQSPGGNERDYGDKGQSDWFADKVLGSFSIDYVTPVDISYEFSGVENGECCYEISWTTEMYIEDVLGSQPGDLIRRVPGVGFLTPSRRVKRAKWVLTGSGKCCKSTGGS